MTVRGLRTVAAFAFGLLVAGVCGRVIAFPIDGDQTDVAAEDRT